MGNEGETVSPLRGSTLLVGVNPGLTSRAMLYRQSGDARWRIPVMQIPRGCVSS